MTVGTIEPRKNLSQLLEVFEEIWRSGLRPELRIYGSYGWNFYREKNKIDKLIFEGFPLITKLNPSTDEIFRDLRKARGLILTSVAEGVGLTPGEAISVGIPAIVNAIPSVLETYSEELLHIYDGTNLGLKKIILENIQSDFNMSILPPSEVISWEKTALDFLKILGE
jgi:glycosyltransferase involved in cell wall biosynthesis